MTTVKMLNSGQFKKLTNDSNRDHRKWCNSETGRSWDGDYSKLCAEMGLATPFKIDTEKPQTFSHPHFSDG